MPFACAQCGSTLGDGDRFCHICGWDAQPNQTLQSVVEQPPAPALPAPPASSSRAWAVAGVAAVALAAGDAATLVLTRGEEIAVAEDPARVQAATNDVEPAPADRELSSASPSVETPSAPYREPEGDRAGPRAITGPGYQLIVPTGSEWAVSDMRTANEGRQLSRVVTGPGEVVIRIVHTPVFEAAPNPDSVVVREPFTSNRGELRAVDAPGLSDRRVSRGPVRRVRPQRPSVRRSGDPRQRIRRGRCRDHGSPDRDQRDSAVLSAAVRPSITEDTMPTRVAAEGAIGLDDRHGGG